jgi:hypothetical protein
VDYLAQVKTHFSETLEPEFVDRVLLLRSLPRGKYRGGDLDLEF